MFASLPHVVAPILAMFMGVLFFTLLDQFNMLSFDPEGWIAWLFSSYSTDNPDVIWITSLSRHLSVTVCRWEHQWMLWMCVNPTVFSQIATYHLHLIFVVWNHFALASVSRLLWDVERANNLYTSFYLSSEKPTRLNITHRVLFGYFEKLFDGIAGYVDFKECLFRLLVALRVQKLRCHFSLVV